MLYPPELHAHVRSMSQSSAADRSRLHAGRSDSQVRVAQQLLNMMQRNPSLRHWESIVGVHPHGGATLRARLN
jgi:hypothetical protein